MSLKIENRISFSEGLKAKIKAQCSTAIDLLESKADNDAHHVIHEVRKSFKKIRATLRLARDHIDFYKQENVFFRDQGRRISDIRDATSIIEALDLVTEKYSDQLYNKTFNAFRKYLVERRQQLMSESIEAQNTLSSIEVDLRKKKSESDKWQFNVEGFETIYPSIKRVYKRGRKAYQKASESQKTEDFHEWRKRVKYLRYQLDLLNRIWPPVLSTWEDELHKLSDSLGDDHDLYMLNIVADKNKELFADEKSYQLLKSIIKSYRSRLQNEGLLLGQRCYCLGSKDFTDLLQSSWDAYDQE